MTAIFFHNGQQKKLALETKDQVAARSKEEVYTQILPATEFYLAEDYHQKYFLRREPELLKELTAIYPATKDFLASTAAARLNGYVAGYGTRAGLEAEISSLGLSLAGNKRLAGMVSKSEPARPTQGCPLPR
jgi:peptide-methionine (S)-S-oxide reductase